MRALTLMKNKAQITGIKIKTNVRMNMGDYRGVFRKFHRICEYNVCLSLLGWSVGFVVPCGASRWQHVTGCGSCDPWICRTCKGKR